MFRFDPDLFDAHTKNVTMNAVDHSVVMQLAIGYTLVGAFIFTVVVTLLSMIGLVRFADPKQQQKLFTVLIVELVVICVGVFGNLVRLDPGQVKKDVQLQTIARVVAAPNVAAGKWIVLIGNYDDRAEAERRQTEAAQKCQLTNSEIFQQLDRHFLRFTFDTEAQADAAIECLKARKISRSPTKTQA
jgi:hypothetical protein